MRLLYRFFFRSILFLTVLQLLAGCSRPDDSVPEVVLMDTLRVLAIGNSFSEDALQYLHDLGKAKGKIVITGNMYYGGCSLEQHWVFIKKNQAVYDFQKNANGTVEHNYNYTLLQGLLNEKWDVISMQQYSAYSGMVDTYFPYLDSIAIYVKRYALNAGVKLALHQTWAYPANSTYDGFDYYGNDQQIMYSRIVTSVREAAQREGISVVIPSGTAIQNARGYFGDILNRDGLHLTYSLGRYVASCTWFEVLTGINVTGNTFSPDGVTAIDAWMAQLAAHYAVANPDEVTNMSKN